MVEFIGSLIFDLIGYCTARLLLPFLTFQHVQVQGVSNAEGDFNAFGFKRWHNGTLLCASDMAGWIGLGFWAALFAILLIIV